MQPSGLARRENEWKSMGHHPSKDDLTTMFQILDTTALRYMKESIKQNSVINLEVSLIHFLPFLAIICAMTDTDGQ